MRRKAFNVAALVSMLLCLVCVVVWVRSEWVETYGWAGAPGPGSAVVMVERGDFMSITCGGWPRGAGWHWSSERLSGPNSYTPGVAPDARGSLAGNWGFDLPGVEVLSQRGWLILPRAAGTVSTALPTAPVTLTRMALAWPAVVLSVLPVVWVCGELYRRRKGAAGHCTRCGYDLTGNVSGVCPECGGEVKGVTGANV